MLVLIRVLGLGFDFSPLGVVHRRCPHSRVFSEYTYLGLRFPPLHLVSLCPTLSLRRLPRPFRAFVLTVPALVSLPPSSRLTFNHCLCGSNLFLMPAFRVPLCIAVCALPLTCSTPLPQGCFLSTRGR